ncbi:hypothetical protein [Rhizobium ruizarguesonis]|jgi:hypothetical protein|uniref:hypothetical protein n=1 Tax=Rhizobium ruizarguesonis TaxID=2081791 RepID=UPI0013DFE344|nr:hypothetical protein [Rhizobium ruizarguesonis]NEJ98560.1 hypothetical protein [Rhizobium ruizarguesonis]
MAYYKDGKHLTQQNGPEFDTIHKPGSSVPFSGIYRCTGCGQSIVSTFNNPFPPQNHHQHAQHVPIAWQLVVKAHWK